MYRKTVIAATLAMLTSLAVYADTVYDATPADTDGVCFTGGAIAFEVFDMTCVVSTDLSVPSLPEPPVVIT